MVSKSSLETLKGDSFIAYIESTKDRSAGNPLIRELIFWKPGSWSREAGIEAELSVRSPSSPSPRQEITLTTDIAGQVLRGMKIRAGHKGRSGISS